MESDASIATGRAKRQKLDKKGRFAALDKLKKLKGSKNKYEIDEVKNVYDEVDEREYSKKVLERQDDDWIVDDGEGGYVEDGREIFDDDIHEERPAETSKRKGKGPKKPTMGKPNPDGGSIRSMFANMPSKKKVVQSQEEADDLLADIIGEVSSDKSKLSTVSSKDYLKTFSTSRRQAPIPVVTSRPAALTERPQPVTQKRPRSPEMLAKPLVNVSKSKPAFIREKTPELEPELDNQIEESMEINSVADETDANVTSETIDIEQPSIGEEEFLNHDNHFDDELSAADFNSPVKPSTAVKQSPVNVADAWFEDEWNGLGGDNIEANIVIDTSSLPLVANEKGEKVFRFYWWDAYEDPFKQPGTLYLFGKVFVPAAKTHVSCCLAVKNIQRRVFLLPRERKMDMASKTLTDEPVTLMDVYQEFNQKVANTNKIMNFKSRKVTKKYAFDLPDVPAESEYLEIKYPATHNKLPADLQGETFSRVFGYNASSLELFLVERKIRGPCWLDVQAPQLATPVSWCKVELSCSKPEDVSIATVVAPAPPITVMAVNVRTVLNSRNMQSEVVMLSCLIHTKFAVDKPAPVPGFEQHFCAYSRPSDVPWPFTLNREKAGYKGTKLHQHESERSLLGFFLTKVFITDPDLIVGHDLYGFTLDTLIHRIEHHKVPNWSRIGRLKRSLIPQLKGRSSDKNLVCGRLVCDTMVSARELIRARSYDLDTLSKQVLRVPENKRQDLTLEEVKEMYGSANGVLSLVNANMQDAHFVLRLMYELNVVPLALQITSIAGNVMSRTLLGGRSERNEYLLLHAFSEKEYIVPDKTYGKKPTTAVEEADGAVKGKRKPDYAGGLVLDPKKGFYDKYILLMDFNSLYPSIIQEYNICFTTVTRTQNPDEEPQAPGPGLPMGILPIEIRKLVESRKLVKNLMKASDLSVDLKMQYNIRQTALKLTANSMYGCLGFPHSRFYAKPLAALVTSRGREILMNTRDVVEKMNYEVIYGDTDSIMINSNCVSYDQVLSIGNKIKQEINKLYKHVELEVDGVFKYMLLLKKKKYAAVVLNKKPNGELVATQEYKGLDIVRRDWSQLSAEIGRFVLNQILSDVNPDERIASIRAHLEKVAADLKAGVVPTALLAITKQLAKNPEDYPDRKALPHLQVAMRINSKGGKKLKAGDTVSYIICDDGSNLSAVQRAYHVDELKGNDKLIIDVNYYLSQQIHPVVSRLCEPIDGLDAAFIAESLGLDPASYRRAAAKRAQAEEDVEDPDCNILDDLQYFRQSEKFSFSCANPSCKTEIFMDHPIYDNYPVLSKCRNPACKTAPVEYLSCIQNALQLAIRSFQKKLYENWMICEDPACPNRSRRVPMQFVNSFPVCTTCRKGLMYREFSNPALYYQLKFFSYMFNTKSVKQPLSTQLENAYKTLFEQAEEALSACAYRIVDFSKIFKFALQENKGKSMLSVSQRSIADSQKKWAAI